MQPSSPGDRPAASTSTQAGLRDLAAVRFSEVLVLEGPPLLGALCAMGAVSPHSLGSVALLAAGNGCLVGHIFTLNDWAGHATDRREPHRSLITRPDPSAGTRRPALLELA